MWNPPGGEMGRNKNSVEYTAKFKIWQLQGICNDLRIIELAPKEKFRIGHAEVWEIKVSYKVFNYRPTVTVLFNSSLFSSG